MPAPLLLFAVWLVVGAWTTGTAQSAPESSEPVRVLVLGTWHFANYGADLNNAQSDDVLTPRRQAEIVALAEALATFAPTAVATERRTAPPYVDPGWAGFPDSVYTFARDEAIQIGFRVAQFAGADRVYAIDEQPSDGEPSYFPIGAVRRHAEATGRTDELAALTDGSSDVAAFEAAQDTLSIPELLLLKQLDDDAFYWSVLRFGDGKDQPGPELAASWFLRNAKIFNKLVQVTRPGDRVVVVFGSGHGPWLREMVRRTPGFELEPAEPYLRAAAALLRRRR